MKTVTVILIGMVCSVTALLPPVAAAEGPLAAAIVQSQTDIATARAELAETYRRIGTEKKDLVTRCEELAAEIATLRQAAADTRKRSTEHHTAETAAKATVEHLTATHGYITALCIDYRRSFETRLSAAEAHHAEPALESIDKALGMGAEAITADTLGAILDLSIDRCRARLGGDRFAGEAVDVTGKAWAGDYLVFGPIVFFQGADAEAEVGLAVQEVGSLSPTVYADFEEEEKAALAQLFETGQASVPIDITMGSGVRLHETRETIAEHLRKGGITMIPLLALGCLCVVIILLKMITVLALPTSHCRRRVAIIIEALNNGDAETAAMLAAKLKRPLRAVITEGLAHRHAAKEHLEEILYEQILSQVPALERFLSALAVCASAAPLLGLLGTVTGMIHTFHLITVFGTGDARLLSSGISEALITTEVGLMIAIPALLFHAYLSRRVRRTVSMAQEVAVAFVNGIKLKGNSNA